MPKTFMLLFDPLTHADAPFQAPAGVLGDIMGDTPAGLMGVYEMPEERVEAFLAAVDASPVVLKCKPLLEGKRA